MFIKYLKLHKYKNFPLMAEETFELTIDSKALMISGSNGAGKTRSMFELSPLPADRVDFYKGGYKEVHIEMNKQEFVLRSDFTGTPKYSFLMDGEELNHAGLVTMQRDLVYQHFRITPDIRDILVGIENFTDMSLPARKKLFSTITNLNIDEVLKGYNELRERLKTSNLLLKTQTSNYKNEEAKLIPKEEEERRRKELQETKETIDKLLSMRSELSQHRVTGASDGTYNTLRGLVQLNRTFIASNYPMVTSYPRKDISEIKLRLDREYTRITYKLDDLYSLLEKWKKELELAKRASVESLSELTDKISDLTTKIDNRIKGLTLVTNYKEVTDKSLSDLYKLESTLPDVVSQMEPNSTEEGGRKFTSDKYNSLVEEKKKLVDELHHLNALEISLKNDNSKLEDIQGRIECPSCSFSWPLKDALRDSSDRENELVKVYIKKKELSDSLATNEKILEQMTHYFTQYRYLSGLRKETSDSLPYFWDRVDTENHLTEDPNKITSLLYVLNRDLTSIKEIFSFEKELETLNEQLSVLKMAESSELDITQEQVNELEYKCSEYQRKKFSLDKEIKNLTRLEGNYLKLDQVKAKMEEGRSSVRDFNRTHMVNSLISVIDDYVRDLNLSLVQMDNELHQVDTINYTLKQYQKDIDNTTEEIKVLNAMLTELCPKSGLIAKSVSSFLNMIIHNVNNTIDKIWDYKMVLKPIDVETDALNYRFKVEVEDELVVNDISTVSRGMKEAINLSFKLVLYKLLDLDNYPLFLDELGSNLDKNHTQRLLHLVSSLSNSDRFSQIFIVTHKESFNFIRDMQEVSLS